MDAKDFSVTDPSVYIHATPAHDNDSVPAMIVPPAYNQIDSLIKRIDQVPFYSSLPMDTTQRSMKVYNYKNCMTNGVAKMKMGGGIRVRDIVMYHTSYENQDGEEVSGPCMILIDDIGIGYRIGARYLIKQILEFMRDFQAPPFEPSVLMRCSDTVLDNGHRMYSLQVGED